MAKRKSSGNLKFEREANELFKSCEAGEISVLQLNLEVIKALKRSAHKMNEDELLEVQRWLFTKMIEVTDVLVELGHPAPGNDPKFPN